MRGMDTLLSLQQLAGFLLASVLITLAPGPDNLLVLSLGVARGRRAGIAFGLGCAAGCLNHTALAALGVSALIAASQSAFSALKMAGGLYLIWIGYQAIRHAGEADAVPDAGNASANARQLFVKGLVANAINPKVVLFFLAFLPQFVDTASGHSGWQILQLGGLFALQAALIFGLIGWSAGTLGGWFRRTPGISHGLNRIAGGVFVLLGAKLIVDR